MSIFKKYRSGNSAFSVITFSSLDCRMFPFDYVFQINSKSHSDTARDNIEYNYYRIFVFNEYKLHKQSFFS